MPMDRRKFFKVAAVGCGSAACAVAAPACASEQEAKRLGADGFGMLQDSVRCIGCKACQSTCKEVNQLAPDTSLDETLYDSPRELSENTYTLIKMHQDETGEATFVKRQCMHCIDPACQSACLVGALKKQQSGAVTWDGSKCMGCRYCMVACPFNVPQFQWKAAIPSISKCTLCEKTRLNKNQPTGCAAACPAGAITFGRRDALLKIARARIAAGPALYLDHIYGEAEVGGTNVLYLTKKQVAFAKIGLPEFGYQAPPRLTEGIQHGVFKYFIPPLALYAALGGIMAYTNRKHKAEGGSDE